MNEQTREQILPSHLALSAKPELTFYNRLGFYRAEYVLGVFAVYCQNRKEDSFDDIPTGHFFAFLMRYGNDDLTKTNKYQGLNWLINRKILNLTKTGITMPATTFDILRDFLREQQVHSALSAHL